MKLKPTCLEVHRLISERLDRKLTRMERLRRRLHLVVCGICRLFSAQMQLLHRAMQRFEIQDDVTLGSRPEPPASPASPAAR